MTSVASSDCPAAEMQQHLLWAVAALYAHTEGPVPEADVAALAAHLPDGSPIAEVARTIDARIGRVIAVALSEVLYECGAALDYAEFDGPAHRLACKIIEALNPMAPDGAGDPSV